MISYRFVPISRQKGVLFFETPGRSSDKTVSRFLIIERVRTISRRPK